MCPLRVWLLFFSGIIAAYLAWTSSLFGGNSDATSPKDGSTDATSTKVGWRDYAKFAFDGLSGKYLYNTLRTEGKTTTPSPRRSTRERGKTREREDTNEGRHEMSKKQA